MSTVPELESVETAAIDYQPTVRVKLGAHALADLGDLAKACQGSRVLLVTDQGLVAAGHAPRAVDYLERAGLRVFVFSDVEENPTTTHVEKCRAFAEQAGGIDLIVALGGGSSMDCAKAANFLLTNGGSMEDYWGRNRAKLPMLPSIGIPTTAGTGSEAQCFALISQEGTHRKMACGDLKARFRAVILDPTLLSSAPRQVIATTGMDAITHAVESFVTTSRNPFSQLFAKEAWRLLEANLERVLADRNDLEAWQRMLLGAHYAGTAIENSMLGAAHACANPLTARFDVTHGLAVGLMLPHVIRFNQTLVLPLYEELATAAHLGPSSDGNAAQALAARIEELHVAAGLPSRLSELGIAPSKLAPLAEEASTQWTGKFNPRPTTTADFQALYRSAF